ncbi:DUF1850 domain-containing protein [Bacillus alveayuensis]|jgi:hypothetical protein|uniref:RocC n=1 Tax=Aeribacillus alveayuensis TaxID=279215 RepID=A0ABT9VNF7_9BACI|nr:DUF1850 domain-containing protein [Bacillus alveayuensis]MDQ0162522.1 hypothetical protein [Bacillus alveayuensis]
MVYKRTFFFFLPLLSIIAFVLFFPFKQVIAFYYEDTNQLLAYLPIQEEKTFQIEYTHSIHLTDVVETYQRLQNELVLTELEYENFAIGMPANAEGNESFVKKDGKYYILNMNRRFSFIDLRIGQVRANHKVIVDGKKYKLANFIKAGTWVRIKPTKLNIWQQLKGVDIDGS